MILYFSSTGNCKHVAERLAEATCDRAVSITETEHVHLLRGEKLGFVFPTYFWRLPSVVDDCMKRLELTSEDASPYLCFVATYGSTCGQTGTYMKRHLKKKGFALSAAFGIKTVDDWTVWFDANDTEAIRKQLDAEEEQLAALLPRFCAGERGDHMKNKLPMIAVMGSNFFYRLARRTKHLHVDSDACIGCGLCQGECPTDAIELREGKPVWVKEHCSMCLHCLHACPAFAIQYDAKTQAHGQYRHP